MNITFGQLYDAIIEVAPVFKFPIDNAWRTGIFIRKEMKYRLEMDGDEIDCLMYKVPEFSISDEDQISVTAHTLIVPASVLIEPLGTNWTTDHFGLVPEPCKRTRKRQSLTGFLSDIGLSGTECERVSRTMHARISKVKLRMEVFAGEAIIEQYKLMDPWSHSCMTGNRCGNVEIYAENPSQIRLGIVYNEDDKPYGRFMLWRPLPPGTWAVSDDEPAVGPGWFYTRVYTTGSTMGSTDKIPDMDYIKSLLHSIGIKEWTDGRDVVYTKKGPEELCPYLDGSMMIRHLGPKVVLFMAGNPHSGWEDANERCMNPYGGGFNPPSCECEHCGSSYNEEDEECGHVNGWGHCCASCYEEGIYCDDTEEVHDPDECYPVVSRADGRTGWATDEFRRTNWRTRERVQMVFATNSSDERVIAPMDETIDDEDGNRYWWNTDEEPPVKLTKRLVVKMLYGLEPRFELEDWDELTFSTPIEIGGELVSVHPSIHNRTIGNLTFTMEDGEIKASHGASRLRLVSVSIANQSWALVDNRDNVKGTTSWDIPDSLLGVCNGITWVELPPVAYGEELSYMSVGMCELLMRPVDGSTIWDDRTAIMSRRRTTPITLNDIGGYDGLAYFGCMHDADGSVREISGQFRNHRFGTAFIIDRVNRLIGVKALSGTLHRTKPMQIPSVEIMNTVALKLAQNPNATVVDINNWLNGGTDVAAQ